MAQRFYHKVAVQVAIVTGIAAIIIAVMHICNNRSQLKTDNENYVKDIESLKQEIQKKTAEVQRLEIQLTPFRTIAIEKFTGSEQEALRKLAEELRKVKKSLSPRVLSPEQITKIAQGIQNFQDMRVRIEIISSNSEAEALGRQLRMAFEAGGWVVEKFTIAFRPGIRPGITLSEGGYLPSQAAETLKQLLWQFGFEPILIQELEVPAGVIKVVIGEKR